MTQNLSSSLRQAGKTGLYSRRVQQLVTIAMSNSSAASERVDHDKTNRKFFIRFEGTSKEGLLAYSLRDGNAIDLEHTYVPDELRGKGIAAQLTLAALRYAAKNSLAVIPSCSYVHDYVQKHRKEFQLDPELRNLKLYDA